MNRMTLRQRIADRLDRLTAEADFEAASNGLAVVASARWSRTYRDPRFDALALARAGGCECVPMCVDVSDCPMHPAVSVCPDLRKVA